MSADEASGAGGEVGKPAKLATFDPDGSEVVKSVEAQQEIANMLETRLAGQAVPALGGGAADSHEQKNLPSRPTGAAAAIAGAFSLAGARPNTGKPRVVGDPTAGWMAAMRRLPEAADAEWNRRNIRVRIGPEGAAVLAKVLQTDEVLKKLNLEEQALGDAGVIALAPAFRDTPRIVELVLYGNGIGDDGAVALGEALASHTCPLERLSVSHNEITGLGIKSLADALAGHPTLINVSFRANPVTDVGCKAIAQALKKNRVLRKLNLSRCRISSGIFFLLDALHVDSVALEELDLSENEFDKQVCNSCADLEKQANFKGTRLVSLSLYSNRIEDAPVPMLGPQMRVLGLSKTALSSPRAVFEQLAARRVPLQELDLSRLRQGDQLVADLLSDPTSPFLQSVRVLTLGHNSMSAVGGRMLADALGTRDRPGKAPQLRELKLWTNSIKDAGAADLAVPYSKLERLEIGKNELGDAAVDTFVHLLGDAEACESLKALVLRNNPGISPNAILKLARVLRANSSLRELDLFSCQSNREAFAAMEAALKDNWGLVAIDLDVPVGEDDLQLLSDVATNRSFFEAELEGGQQAASALLFRDDEWTPSALSLAKKGRFGILNHWWVPGDQLRKFTNSDEVMCREAAREGGVCAVSFLFKLLSHTGRPLGDAKTFLYNATPEKVLADILESPVPCAPGTVAAIREHLQASPTEAAVVYVGWSHCGLYPSFRVYCMWPISSPPTHLKPPTPRPNHDSALG